jgi:hypothetical protein
VSRSIRALAAAAAAAGLLMLQACGTLPVATKPVGCNVDDETLKLVCAAPRPVADGITYGDVLGIARQDRKALLDCQTHLKTALAMLADCRSTTDAYSREIDRINAEMKAQR